MGTITNGSHHMSSPDKLEVANISNLRRSSLSSYHYSPQQILLSTTDSGVLSLFDERQTSFKKFCFWRPLILQTLVFVF